MANYSQASSISAYRSVAAHGVVADANPHQLITMLMDGALDRLVSAKGCIERGALIEKSTLLHRVGEIISELSCSLNHSVGGSLSKNLEQLYQYMMKRVLHANLKNDAVAIDEVSRLLTEIREAWVAIPADFRTARKAG